MSPKFSLRTNQKYLLRILTQALESGKAVDQKLSADNWVSLAELFACITGLKAQQGKPLTVPKLKPRGRSAGVNFDKILKEEAQRKKLALAQAEAEQAAEKPEETQS